MRLALTFCWQRWIAGGLAARFMGAEFLDPVAGMMVGAMIIKAAASIGLESIRELTDQSMDEQLLEGVGAMVRVCVCVSVCVCAGVCGCVGVDVGVSSSRSVARRFRKHPRSSATPAFVHGTWATMCW